MNPSDPQVLQSRAELAIRNQHWMLAEQYAQRSFDSGAKLGSLCRRNWLTLHYARMAQVFAGVQGCRPELAGPVRPMPKTDTTSEKK